MQVGQKNFENKSGVGSENFSAANYVLIKKCDLLQIEKKGRLTSEAKLSLVWCLCLMVYQPSRVIICQI